MLAWVIIGKLTVSVLVFLFSAYMNGMTFYGVVEFTRKNPDRERKTDEGSSLAMLALFHIVAFIAGVILPLRLIWVGHL